MAFIICEPCVDVKDTACVEVCPVDCIYDFEGGNQLYIHPTECIDCAACEPECPVEAIFTDADVPSQWQSYIALNLTIFDKHSTDQAVGRGGDTQTPSDGPESVPAAAESAALAGAVTVSSLSRDRVHRILQTVEEGVLDASA